MQHCPDYAANLDAVRHGIAEAARKAGRDPSEVRLVAVSKYHPPEAVAALARLGVRDFGENYVQEALAKQEALASLGFEDISWHFIGGLQSNKAKFVVGRFALIHSVDSLKLARRLQDQAGKAGVVQDVLLQVNLAGEVQKCGAAPAEVLELAETVLGCDALRLRGLMLMPPDLDDPEQVRPYFAGLRCLAEELRARLGAALPELSMGMTGDYPVAVAEGATIVRIGTRLFGPRPCALSQP